MKRYDVLVVGGGPAGSTAAHRLATAGASVLLVDKARFPRDKPCGGGLTMRAVRRCPVDVSSVVEDEVTEFALAFRYGRHVHHRMKGPAVWMTQRARLDAFLLGAAQEAGVDVRQGVTVKLGDRMTVDGNPVAADYVVGADGANGTSARALGLGNDIYRGVAYEGNVGYGTVERGRYAGRAFLEIGAIPGGYGWVFPKGDHVNVGVGAWADEGPRLRDHLRRVCEAHGIQYESLDALGGHRLPLRSRTTRVAGERALLVGDAAGLIDPISGDGMYECFVSSELAATAIVDALSGRQRSLEPYSQALQTELGAFLAESWKLKRALDRWPRASWRLARTALVWRTVERLLQGDLVSPADQRGLARLPLRALSGLGR